VAEGNVELLRPVYEEWSQGNFRPVTDAYGADLEWGWSGEFPDIAGVEHGTEGQDPRLTAWLRAWEHWTVDPQGYLTSGDHVVVLARYRGRGKGSGVDVDSEGAHLWTVEGGRARRMVVYSDRERAIEDAGLDPASAQPEPWPG
jgi:uncharacterized protein